VAEQARRKSISIDINVPDAVHVLADAKRLRQLLLNLLSNAVKFTPAGGRIEIRAETGPLVAIHCIDTGIGIAPDQLEIVFEPFRQVDSSLARKYEGTGLGLPIARSIAEQHGGSLVLTSELGAGTTVTAFLPSSKPGA
jgi:signal transduction histidine kinase